MFVIDEKRAVLGDLSPPGCVLTHTLTHTRKGAERAGNGRKPPGEKSVWIFGGIRGGRGESVPGGYGGDSVVLATELDTTWGVFSAPAVGGFLPSPRWGFSLFMR